MKKTFLVSLSAIALIVCSVFAFKAFYALSADMEATENEEHEYDGPDKRDEFEFDRIKDPALGYVPYDRLMNTVDKLYALRNTNTGKVTTTQSGLTWAERGPIYDLVGPAGNPRGGINSYTAGRVTAVFIDTLNDPTGNTAFVGGVAGGLWKCTNFLATAANWQHLDDRFDNMAIASICQNPANPSVLYFSTGEPTSHSDAVLGGGVWKSTNAGTTWTKLSSSTGFTRSFKILCDASGNVYLANRSSVISGSQASGLYRSINAGVSWQSITPTGLTANTTPSDIEISSSGRLHASFGFGGTKVQHVYTNTPATVTTTGWTFSTGIRNSATSAYRLELATSGNVMYAVTVNNGQLDSCYKSINDGTTWTKQNTAAFSTSILNSQGWYDLTLAINPNNSNEFIVGGLDAYKSTNSGVTIPTRVSYWVSNSPYVHADHHFISWRKAGSESRIIIGSDGGVFYSNDGGSTFTDKNKNLVLKQFYSADIHPDAGSNYLIAGAQDNGVHTFTNPGLSWSTEALGGDGCFVHINQLNPLIQFGSYVYNDYEFTADGGLTWGDSVCATKGYFVNPFDYDDGQNILYSSNANSGTTGEIVRWFEPTGASVATLLPLTALGANASAFKVSPFTKDRVFVGGSNGRIIRLDNASNVTTATVAANVTTIATTLSSAYMSCINTGSSDNYLVATFSSYGVSHVWTSANGGTTWTNISGNLPDIPVRWAMFDPQNNSKMFLATEAGVFYTDAINGSSTVWTSDIGFPLVRTDMLKFRLSDNTVVAATHGRGLFTAQIPSTPEVRFNAPMATYTETTSGTSGCRTYKDYTIKVSVTAPPTGDATVNYSIEAGNTATPGADFDFTTNGSFTSPSTQHLFTSGAAATKNITLRIYDDAEVESIENFNIHLTVSGTTDAFASSYNRFQVSIKDNDAPPSSATNAVETALNATQTNAFGLSPGVIPYYSASGKIMASIKSLSNFDYGCTQVTVDRAGSAALPFTSSATANYLMSKTFQVVPATNNIAGQYQVTLYFTAAEKVGWESGTGQVWNNIKLIKVKSQIANYTPATPNPDGPNSIEIATPTFGTYGSDFTLTATFSSGFGGIGAGVTTCAAPAINTPPASQAVCSGSAANFSVAAAGSGLSYQWLKDGFPITGATASTYSIPVTAITDAGTYTVVVNGSCGTATSAGAILSINTGTGCTTAVPSIDADVTSVALMPNIIHNNTVLRVNARKAMKVNWRVIDASGREVMSFTQQVSGGTNDLPLQFGTLASGTYHLLGYTNKGRLSALRFVKN